jgi:hypothetical protein
VRNDLRYVVFDGHFNLLKITGVTIGYGIHLIGVRIFLRFHWSITFSDSLIT